MEIINTDNFITLKCAQSVTFVECGEQRNFGMLFQYVFLNNYKGKRSPHVTPNLSNVLNGLQWVGPLSSRPEVWVRCTGVVHPPPTDVLTWKPFVLLGKV